MKDFFKNVKSVIFGRQGVFNCDIKDKNIDEIIKKIIEQEEIKISRNNGFIRFENGNILAILWDDNKYYGWLNKGRFVNKENGFEYDWNHSMPSRYMSEELLTYIDRKTKEGVENGK